MASAALALGLQSGQPGLGSHDGAWGRRPPRTVSRAGAWGVAGHSLAQRPALEKAEGSMGGVPRGVSLAPTRCPPSPADAFQGKGRAGHICRGPAGCWWSLNPKQGLRWLLAGSTCPRCKGLRDSLGGLSGFVGRNKLARAFQGRLVRHPQPRHTRRFQGTRERGCRGHTQGQALGSGSCSHLQEATLGKDVDVVTAHVPVPRPSVLTREADERLLHTQTHSDPFRERPGDVSDWHSGIPSAGVGTLMASVRGAVCTAPTPRGRAVPRRHPVGT